MSHHIYISIYIAAQLSTATHTHRIVIEYKIVYRRVPTFKYRSFVALPYLLYYCAPQRAYATPAQTAPRKSALARAQMASSSSRQIAVTTFLQQQQQKKIKIQMYFK